MFQRPSTPHTSTPGQELPSIIVIVLFNMGGLLLLVGKLPSPLKMVYVEYDDRDTFHLPVCHHTYSWPATFQEQARASDFHGFQYLDGRLSMEWTPVSSLSNTGRMYFSEAMLHYYVGSDITDCVSMATVSYSP